MDCFKICRLNHEQKYIREKRIPLTKTVKKCNKSRKASLCIHFITCTTLVYCIVEYHVTHNGSSPFLETSQTSVSYRCPKCKDPTQIKSQKFQLTEH